MSSGRSADYTYVYLTLWKNKDNEKLTFCRIELFPTFPTYQKANEYVKDDVDLMMMYLYEESTFHNWNLLYLKNSFQFINNKLTKSEDHWLYTREISPELSLLKKDTLFIQDYSLIKFNAFTGDESKRLDIGKLMKKYPYLYKVVSHEELIDKLLHTSKTFYYLSYVKSSTDKYVGIINGRTGDFLYKNYSPMSYNLKDKDFEKIHEALK